jgi:hypothetical protein
VLIEDSIQEESDNFVLIFKEGQYDLNILTDDPD